MAWFENVAHNFHQFSAVSKGFTEKKNNWRYHEFIANFDNGEYSRLDEDTDKDKADGSLHEKKKIISIFNAQPKNWFFIQLYLVSNQMIVNI